MRRLESLKGIYKERKYLFISTASALLFAIPLFYFTHYEEIAGNLGRVYANVQVTAQAILIILFGINIALLWHRISMASSERKEAGSTAVGSIISILVSGCPACGITLASYLGIVSVFSVFPFFGLELKFFGIALLLFSIYSLLGKMSCDFKPI